MATSVLEIELAQGISDRHGLTEYGQAFVLLRFHGRPLGTVRVPCQEGVLRAVDVGAAIESDGALSWHLTQSVLMHWLTRHEPTAPVRSPTWSIVICTRNRTDDLRRCLDSLLKLETPGGEIIVVDNAPSDGSTAKLASGYPVRYVREDRVGLNWARSRGARAAIGEIVIYTDDDVVLDPHWVSAILEPFDHPRVAAVTGLTMPLELETEAQELFEVYGGLGRGFRRRVFDYTTMAPAAAGIAGAGVNMALRRELINDLRLFDAELDCGTVTQTGGDTYAFYRLLAAGYQIVYTPEALVWHRHRRDYASLRKTLAGYSVGGFAFLTRCWLRHGDWQAPAVAASWFWHDHLRQLARSVMRRPKSLPLDLVLAQIVAVPRGPWAYLASRQRERAVISTLVNEAQAA
jgi:glycosyltransferase involved in cell wall biosynthesis